MQKPNKKLQGFITLYLNFLCFFIIYTALPATAYPATVQDSKGNYLTISHTPQRVVSLVPSATEIIFKLKAKNSVKGVTYHDAGLPGAAGQQVVGGFFSPSPEKIQELEPDMIILSPLHKDIVKRFKKTDCILYVFKNNSIEDAWKNISSLGKIFNREKNADIILQKNRSEIQHIRQKLAAVKNLEKKRVIRLMGKETIMTPGSDSFQNQLIRAAGGIPPDFGKKGSIIDVTKKEWMDFNPQVIYGCTPDKAAAKKFFSRSGWKDVDAVKNNQIYYFPCDLTCRVSTHTGYFVSWLSSVIYTREYSKPENDTLSPGITRSTPLKTDLDNIRSASIIYSNIFDFENKTLIIDFKTPQKILSTLEGFRENITGIGNHYTPPPTWGPGYIKGIDHLKSTVLSAIHKNEKTFSFLMTGADMEYLSIQTRAYKDMKVYAFVTAGVTGNAQRMSKDSGSFYEPGTINIILLTNMKLSKRAMTRSIITATESKTAALEDMDIRSSFTPRLNAATGTGTDNILVVQGTGAKIDNTGGHSKMGQLIAAAVHAGVKEAILKQNGISADRTIFQRLKERNINLYQMVSGASCGCADKYDNFAAMVEHLLLEPEYAAFIESALAVSDAYERGLIKSLTPFNIWCRKVADTIAGYEIEELKEMISDDTLPLPLKMSFNAIMNGVQARLIFDNDTEAAVLPQKIISLSPIITETLYLLNAQDLLTANTTYCNVPEKAKFKEKIGSVIQMDVEKIIRLTPDLVIASPLSREKQLKILENQGIRVMRIKNPQTFSQMCDITLEIGRVTGRTDLAEKIIKKASTRVEALKLKALLLPKKKVFIQIGMKPLHTANKNMFINEYIKDAGGINIAENEKSGIYSREKVLKENPDVILIATMGTSKKAGRMEKQRWMTFKSLTAAKKKQVYVLDPELILSPTPVTFAKGLKQVLSLIHPDMDLKSSTDQKSGVNLPV